MSTPSRSSTGRGPLIAATLIVVSVVVIVLILAARGATPASIWQSFFPPPPPRIRRASINDSTTSSSHRRRDLPRRRDRHRVHGLSLSPEAGRRRAAAADTRQQPGRDLWTVIPTVIVAVLFVLSWHT